ncbi:anaerobic ribonucleoside-triphosphate reductase activating protein [Halolactibacillus halophilus]|uniref:Anaerobic ribonucleoside-triphosphate reductase-activating protein n=1 Tax=Halolactibacillus halophilus TaxID=306540 RepID=A0A1I5RIG4_9BACI|nr:anaerobic ribonucleoside-triphosphate reductase activating protein [Halolactibacillus halophilus]GEM02349.1 anaerobic ribonucleoside-triphosphate reductase-activating protein [Halolactibacillus halophilus]SFP57726.1 anaerobic ribonucleoside-triphosphate reductase activating protein [Halolactibacillus halophilus]
MSESLRVLNIIHDSVVDGPGLRTVLFFSGCPHFCKGCHNPESWNIRNGSEMTIDAIVDEVLSNPLTDVTLSGGDPFFQASGVKYVAKRLKEAGKNIWAYSGYTLEQLLELGGDYTELLSYCDVLVDGPFILAERDLSLDFRGSHNQRIIQLKDIPELQVQA